MKKNNGSFSLSMARNIALAVLLIGRIEPFEAQAQLDPASQEALQKTNELLRSPEQREELKAKDPAAKKADAYVQALGGSAANSQKVYDLSAQVFQKLVEKYKGDPEKLKAVIERAQKDPEGFARSEFTAEELRALKELSGQIQPPPSHPK